MSQRAADLIRLLHDHHLRVFTTADVMTLTRASPFSVTHALKRLSAQGLVSSIKRGLWVNRLLNDFNAMEAVPHLTASWPSYVSLYSALSRHGTIEEVPQSIFAVSAGRARNYRTPIGQFHIHHLPEELIWGFTMEHQGQGSFLIAEKEKAFLDLAYLGLIPRSPLGMPYKRDGRWQLDLPKLAKYAKRFQFPPLIEYLKSRKLWRPNK